MFFSRLNAALLLIFIFFIAIFSFKCKSSKILDEETFVKIYTDIIIYKDSTSNSSVENKTILKTILDKHGVSMDEYKSTVEYYSQDVERWEEFFSKAASYLESKQKIETK